MTIQVLPSGFVGKPIERVEDLRLLRGLGQYVDDLHIDGMLHAAILRSVVAHGRIRSIRAQSALALPGVHAVYTAQDIARLIKGPIPKIGVRLSPHEKLVPYAQPVIAQDTVRYVGEALAIVVADTPAIAEDAVGLIEVDIFPLKAVQDRSNEQEALLFEGTGTNMPITYTASKGDAASVKAPYVRREIFRVQRHSAVCMETRGILATWDSATEKLTVFGAAKAPFAIRRVLAQQMGLAEESIDMIEGDVGGSFGVRGTFHPEDFLVPFAARQLNRPVKWIEDRLENLLSSNHARESEIELEIACETDGTIVALRGQVWTNAGAYLRSAPTGAPRNVAQFLSGPYRIPHIHIESTLLVSNKTPIGTYRGPGRFEADFFRERLLDMAAGDLGIDRIEFRRHNLPSASELPYPLATLTLPDKSEELDTGDYQLTLDRCLAEIDWSGKSALQGKLIDGRYHGLGIGCFIEGGAAGPRENARITIDPTGTISVFVGSANVGQAVETTSLQIVADALGVSMDSIQLFHGSTIYLKEGFGSFHSRSTVMGGTAMIDAANKVKQELRMAAARRLNCAVDEVSIEAGLVARREDRTLSLADLVGEKLEVEGTFVNNKHTYAYGAAAAHVTVDPRSGQVDVLDFVVIEDVGRIVNPLTAKGQVIGAMVQGLGGTLLEEFKYDSEGQLLTGSLADYMLPTATDFPNLRAVVIEHSPSPNNPLGTKGAGEGGAVPVGGVIANAVANALSSLGVEPRELPLTPPKVWALIRAAEARTT
jgi:carbon-monoxide dehydrogenase large subunit